MCDTRRLGWVRPICAVVRVYGLSRLCVLCVEKGQVVMELVDTNGDGVPDAFERRPTITEILNAAQDDSITVALEGPRSPKTGEVFVTSDRFLRATRDYPEGLKFYIVRCWVSNAPVVNDA